MNSFKAAAKKSQAAKLKAYGGTAKHSDVAADKALVKKMVKPEALARAKGGKVKNAKTQVNVVIPRGGPDAGGLGPMGAMARPPMTPPAALPGGAPPMGGAPAPMRPAGLARGGAAKGYDAGAISGEGRLEKIARYGHKNKVKQKDQIN